ncbi:MAG TPA: anthranilate synthase component I [Planctomycetota bacterium]|jgi:anthranilate synthase component 1
MSITPDLKTFLKLASQRPRRLIPVTRRFLADSITPVAAFRRMPESPYAFLLESVERGERIGRYSFVGSAPDSIFRGYVFPQPHYTIEEVGRGTTRRQGDPLAALESYLSKNRALSASASGAPPFAGGGVGYLGYDLVRLIEPRLNAGKPKKPGIEDTPEMIVPIYRTILAFDHVLNTVTVVHHADPGKARSARVAYDEAIAAIEKVITHLRRPASTPVDELVARPAEPRCAVRSNFDQQAFCRAVEKAKSYISAGDIIQVVPSQRFSTQTKAPPFEVYRSLRAINPSPYMFYMHMGDLHLVGSSPEVMVRVEDGLITVRPIAGTRPRGKDAAEDARLAADLLNDPKECAEHVMLVDLGRNDVGRVSEYGSVRIDERMVVESYSHVMHIVSNVSGVMQKGRSSFEVLRSCLPAGTLSGAPKIRAMEIIDELEPDRRGIYGGAVGVMDFLGNLNTAIAIRTFIMRERPDGIYDAHVQAGAGVVADSVPQREYEETQNKAKALLRALSAAESRLNGNAGAQ